MVDKCILLSDSQFHAQNLELARKFLSQNSYPHFFIEKHIKIRQSLLKSNKQHFSKNKCSEILKKKKIVLPFLKNITPKIQNCFKKFNINLINKTTNKLNSVIKLGKDALEKSEQSGIVYEIGCRGCDSVYIGQSKRKLNVRVNEHKRDVKNKDKKSALANHVIDTKHKD